MRKESKFRRFVRNDGEIFRLLVIMVIAFFLILVIVPDRSKFLSLPMLQSMMVQMPELGIYAIAVTLAMLLGGIDLSVVGIGNLCGILSSLLTLKLSGSAGGGPAVAISYLLALAVGALCGLANGALVHFLGVPAMLATLGTMQVFMGISIVVTGGAAVTGMDEAYGAMASAQVLHIPLIMLLFVGILIVISLLLQKRRLGMQIYLLGTNEKASAFSGINNGKVTLSSFMIGGILSAVAGLIMCSRSMSAKADYGSSYILQCLLVAILGGISPFGGKGKVVGILLATITLQMLSSGFNILRFNAYQKTCIWGVVLIMVMIINYYAERRKAA